MVSYNEDTQFTGGNGGAQVPPPLNPSMSGFGRDKKKNNSTLRNAGIGAAAGAAIGGGTAAAMAASPEDEVNIIDIANGVEISDQRPDWAVGDITVARNVDDSMSFSEAFAAARAEAGPGAAFEWHGNVYSTYTESEWAHMSTAEKNAFNDHFSWNHGHTHHETYANHDTHEVHNHYTEVHVHNNNESVEVVAADPEVEVIGVVHDAAEGANYAAVNIDGQDVILIDVDDNMVFDYLAADTNGDGSYQENEIVDISNQGITVNDLGGFTDGYNDLMADNTLDEGPDYSADFDAGVL